MKHPSELVRYAGFAGLATGLAIGMAWGGRDLRESVPRVTELQSRIAADPFRGLTHAGMLLAAHQATAKLEAGRPWAAWNDLRDYVEDEDDAPPAIALLAARAAAGWDGPSTPRVPGSRPCGSPRRACTPPAARPAARRSSRRF